MGNHDDELDELFLSEIFVVEHYNKLRVLPLYYI